MKKILLFGLVMILFASFVQAGLTDGLVHYYNFSSNADDSIGNHDGTIVNLTNVPYGVDGNCYLFDGEDGNGYIDYDGYLNLSYRNGSISLWFNINSSLTENAFLLYFYNDGNNYIRLTYVEDSDKIAYVGRRSGGLVTHDINGINKDTWYNLIILSKESLSKTYIYVNGFLNASKTGLMPSLNNISKKKLGGKYNGANDNNFHGLIDEFGIWDRPLNQSEILQIAKSNAYLKLYGRDIRNDSVVHSFYVDVVNGSNSETFNTTKGNIRTNVSLVVNDRYNITYYNITANSGRPYLNKTLYNKTLSYLNESIYSYFEPYMKVTAFNLNGTVLTDFQVEYNSVDYNSSGLVAYVPSYNDMINISVKSANYVTLNVTVNSSNDYVAYLEPVTILRLNIYNEKTDTIIDDANFTIEVIGDNISNIFEGSTLNGTYIINGSLPPDVYEISYYSDNYPVRYYYIDMNAQSDVNLTLFSLNSTYTYLVTFIVEDNNEDYVRNLIIKANKLFLGRNQYLSVGMCKTNSDGECTMYLETLKPYSWVLQKDELVQNVEAGQLITTTKEFIFNPQRVFEFVGSIYGVQYNLNYTSSDNFRLDYNVLSGAQYKFCLELYNLTYGSTNQITPFESSCQTGSSGIILIPQSIVNQTIMAKAYYNQNPNTFLETIILGDFDKIADHLGIMGLFIALIIILILGLIGVQINPTVGIVTTILGLGITWFIGFFDIAWTYIAGLIVILIILIVGINKK